MAVERGSGCGEGKVAVERGRGCGEGKVAVERGSGCGEGKWLWRGEVAAERGSKWTVHYHTHCNHVFFLRDTQFGES